MTNNIVKYQPEVDVAVLFIFFTRTEITARSFEQIRKARPSMLFLYQDGPRPGRSDDAENIQKCREAVESAIDWDCEIHRMYQEKNYGCDPSEYISQKWMFSRVDKGIIIEDDDVMSISFFRFCKELLNKYENDTRINIICGMNHLGVYEDCPYDYFFSRLGGAIWGWATWKRVIDQWDVYYDFLNDPYAIYNMQGEFGKKQADSFVAISKQHLTSGKEHYESILGATGWLNNVVNIVPKRNMTCNIGVGVETTHSVSDLYKLSRSTRRQLYMKTYELEFPLKHPRYVQADYRHWVKVKKMISGGWFVKLFHLRLIECMTYRFIPAIGKLSLKFDK